MSDPSAHTTIDPQKTFDPLRAATPVSSHPLPTELLELSRSRLRLVSAFLFGVTVVAWPLTTGIRGVFLEEFERVNQWGPVTFLILSSALVLALTYRPRLSGSTLLRVGWAYNVAVSFSWAFMQYLGEFDWIPPEQI
ncbi:MAG: hypothetical protein HKM89_10945, partial [Gemmatimonadales bacterium]|nr:hypothetical protein [Gemmatimonadales bacterium]